MKTALLAIFGIIVLSALFFAAPREGIAPESGPSAEDAALFAQKVMELAIERVGQPIEGFEPLMYIRAFPGVLEEDFDGVEALGGSYVYSGGELSLIEDRKRGYVTSADHAITENGHATLLQNLRARLGESLSVEEIIRIISS